MFIGHWIRYDIDQKLSGFKNQSGDRVRRTSEATDAIKKKVPGVNNLQYDCILGLDVLNAGTKVKNLLNKLQKQIKTHKESIKPKNNKRITNLKERG